MPPLPKGDPFYLDVLRLREGADWLEVIASRWARHNRLESGQAARLREAAGTLRSLADKIETNS